MVSRDSPKPTSPLAIYTAIVLQFGGRQQKIHAQLCNLHRSEDITLKSWYFNVQDFRQSLIGKFDRPKHTSKKVVHVPWVQPWIKSVLRRKIAKVYVTAVTAIRRWGPPIFTLRSRRALRRGSWERFNYSSPDTCNPLLGSSGTTAGSRGRIRGKEVTTTVSRSTGTQAGRHKSGEKCIKAGQELESLSQPRVPQHVRASSLDSSQCQARHPWDWEWVSDSFGCSGQGGLSALQENIPGEPGVDYPIYTLPPLTGFDCEGRVSYVLWPKKPFDSFKE